MQLVVEGERHLNERVIAVVTDVEHIPARQPDGEAHHGERDRLRRWVLGLMIGLGAGHRVIVLSHDVQLETLVGEIRVLLSVDGHLNVAIDVGRSKETGLDADLHLGDLWDVEALACEVGYAVVAALIVCIAVFIRVFIIGIRIIRGFFVSQETLDQLFEFFI